MRFPSVLAFGLLALVGCSSSTPPTDAGTDTPTVPHDVTPDVSVEGIPAPVAAHPLSDPLERLAGLDGTVDVVYDRMGWPHIYATSLRDAAVVQGYVMARDRMPQMEMLRRVASGTLAERFGVLSADLVDRDLAARVLGLRRAANTIWERTQPGRSRTLLEYFARGVNRYLQDVREGRTRLPPGTELVIDQSTPEWTPVDSLVIGRYQSYSLSYDANDDIGHTLFIERATQRFARADAMMRPAFAARRELVADALRWRQLTNTAVVGDFFPATSGMMFRYVPEVDRPLLGEGLYRETARFVDLAREIAEFWGDETRGSNNWVVHPMASMSGHALLANDPHLSLTAPAIWWGSHLTVTRGADAVDVAGTTFPGIPGVIIGFTPRLAWGVTTAGYDVTDVYVETVTPGMNGQPDTVRFNGTQVPIQVMTEAVPTGTGTYMARFEYVPHHGIIVPTIRNGMIVPRTGTRALTIKWTGAEPTSEIDAFLNVAYTQTAAEAKMAVRAFGVGAQNWVIADVMGNVEYTSHANIPVRAAGALTWSPTNLAGTNPCTILPGSGEAEWTGNLAPERIPQATGGPMRPWIATANNDQAGVTFDGNPFDAPAYLGCLFDRGWRAERIAERLRSLGTRMTLDDMRALQGDSTVLAGGRFRPFLMQAMARLEAEWTLAGTHRDLSTLATTLRPRQERLREAARRMMEWSLDGASGVEATATPAQVRDAVGASLFHGWIGQVLNGAFNDEITALNEGETDRVSFDRLRMALFLLEQPMNARTRDMSTGQSVLWDDLSTADVNETRDVILLRALDSTLAGLEMAFSTADMAMWRFGRLHTVRFGSIIPGPGAALSIPREGDMMFPRGFPRPGGFDVVDASGPGLGGFNFSFGSGASQRLVVELDPMGPRAFPASPGGQSANTGSANFRDGAELWRMNQYHPVHIKVADVVGAATRHLRFAAR
jgi:penicillin amidase